MTTEPQPPQMIGGQYRVLRTLGAGGMGQIFYGVHEMTEQPVAIKMLHSEFMTDEVLRDRFFSEAKTLAALEHPNIVQWKNSLEDENGCYIIMQFVEGSNVEELIKQQRSIPLEEAIPIVIHALSGLAYVHSKGVVHRDLKPSNILISNQGEVKLADFGIARLMGTERKTQTGMAVGTFFYMSPEQILAGNIDHRTDIYSMGITLFEMLSGEPPFQGNTEFEVCKKHLESPLPNIRKWKVNLPNEIDTILRRATEKDPKKRYQTAAEFISALSQAFPDYALQATKKLGMSQHATEALLSSLQYSTQFEPPKRSGCMRWVLGGLFLLSAAFGGAYWAYNRIDSSEKIHTKYSSEWVSLPLRDSFGQNFARWPVGPFHKSTITMNPQQYQVQTQAGKNIVTTCPSLLKPVDGDIVIEEEARVEGAASDGRGVHGIALYFDKVNEKSRGYYIALDPPNRKYKVAFLSEGKWNVIVPWTENDAIQKGASNRLRVVVKGATLTVVVNQAQLPALSLQNGTKGLACLFVQQGGTHVTFKQFSVRRPK